MNVVIISSDLDENTALLQPWRHIVEVARRMMKRGINVTIVSTRRTGQPLREKVRGLPVIRLRNLTLHQMLGHRLFRLIDHLVPDVILWSSGPIAAIYLRRLKRLAAPILWNITSEVFHLHMFSSLSLRELLSPFHGFFLIPLLTALLPRSLLSRVGNSAVVSKILVPSRYLKRQLVLIGIRAEKIIVIPSAVRANGTKANLPRRVDDKKGSNNREFSVTYLGAPCTLRGTDTLIESFKHVSAKCEECRLTILSRRPLVNAGREDLVEEAYVVRLTRNWRRSAKIEIIPGILPKSILVERMIQSDLIALPFKILLSEPPLTLLEAMSLGKPVLSTGVGSLPEILKRGRGVVVAPNDPEKLAQAIIELHNNPEKRAAIGREAMNFSRRLPSWDDVANLTVEVAEEAVATNKCSRWGESVGVLPR